MTSAASLWRAKTPAWILLAAMILLPRAGAAASPPSITSQPQSQSVLAGSNAVFKVVASGSPTLVYQWSFNGATLTNSLHIRGATSATLTVSNVVAGDAGIYQVIVTNSRGSMTSSNATLTVLLPPVITTQPASQSINIAPGNNPTAGFSVVATGKPPLQYQWQFNGDLLPGQTNSTLWITTVDLTNDGNYSVVITNYDGNLTSSVASLTVWAVLKQPQLMNANWGGNAFFSVVVTNLHSLPVTYQWWFQGTSFLAGQTNSTLLLTNVQPSQAGSYYVRWAGTQGSISFSQAPLFVDMPPAGVPFILGFTPLQAYPGGTVTISGTNFCPFASNNIVRFGAVQANVISASSNLLTVRDPVSATLAPITVTVNGLTAFSHAPFMPTFPGGVPVSASTFAARQNLSSASGPIETVIADLDGDGKPDLVVANDYSHSVSLFRNISAGGALSPSSFATRVDLPAFGGSNDNPTGMSVADVDGDGKPDILICDRYQNQILIYRNISTAGILTAGSFAAPVAVPTGLDPRHVRVADLDGDGKPDLVVANYGQNSVSILQNTSTPGAISFITNLAGLSAENGVYDVALADFDGDGKPDIAVANSSAPFVSVWRNQGSPRVVSFAPYTNFPALNYASSIMALDVDGDGKPDLVVGSVQNYAVSVFRNQSVPGVLSFEPHVDFGAPGWVHEAAAGDINGDGEPDLVIDGELNSYMAVFQNGSAPGSFTGASLSNRVDFTTGWNAWGVSVSDLDGDGRPDVLLGNFYDGNLSIYQNQVPYGGPPVIISQPANLTLLANNTATFEAVVMGQSVLNYQWYFNGTNLTDGLRFAGSSTGSLAVSNVFPADSGDYYFIVTNSFGSATSAVATLTVLFPPDIIIQPANPVAYLGSNFTLVASGTGATPMSYQWGRNGTNLTDGGNISGATTPALTLTNVQFADAGAYFVVVTNIYGSVTSSAPLRVAVAAGMWVKWDAGSGGNGHSYKAVVNTSGLTWMQADQIARDEGGYLATITSAAENDFVFSVVNDPQFFSGSGGNGSGPALGGVRTNSTSPADADWTWETGEPWSYTAWAAGQPDFPSETRLQFWSGVQGSPSPTWNNLDPTDSNLGGYVIEREDYPSIAFQTTDVTAAVGINVSFTVVALGSPTLTYQWVANGTNIDGATNAALTLTNVQIAQAGYYFVTVSNGFGTVVSSNGTLTVMTPPAIIQSPTNLTVTTGMTATFSAIVAGDPPMSYQWQFNGSPLNDSSHVAGSATDMLTISNVQNSDAGNYTLTVTNPVGSAISTAAVLTVLNPPAITTQPLCRSTPLGLTNIFSAAASGSAPLTYQWQLNGTNIPGATHTSYFIAATGTNDLGVYQFVVSNAVGVAVSSNAWLTAGPVAAWGYNAANQCLVPPGLSNVTTIAGGYTYSLASRLDGNIVAWGNASGVTNSSMTNVTAVSATSGGALALRADGTVVGSVGLSPLSSKVYPSNAVAIAAGYSHGLALRAEGTVVGWGNPQAGGPGFVPAIVPPGLTHVTAIAAGYQHSLALRSDGTVAAWGYGTATNVPVGLSNVVAIAAGFTHSLALKSDGTLVTWGAGAGTNIPAGLSNVMAIAAGGYTDQRSSISFAVRSNGTVIAWGISPYSQTNVPAGLSNVVAVADGSYHTLALVNDGTPQILRQPAGGTAWSGRDWTLQVTAAGAAPLNYQWQLNGTNVDGATNANLFLPAIQSSNAGNYQVIVSNSLGVATSLAAPLAMMDSAPFLLTQPATNTTGYLGNRVALSTAVAGSGPLQYQWQFNGANFDGATNDTLIFNRVHMTNAGNYLLVVSNSFGFATSSIIRLTVQQVVVWGDNSYGQTNMPPGLTNVAAISANFYNNIVLRSDGTLTVWGNLNGIYVPTNSAAGVSNVVEVSAGYNNELVLKSNGKPFMWGQGVSASLTNIVAAQSNIVAVVATSSSGGCAMLRADGTLLQVFTSGVSTSSGVTNGIALETCDDGYLVLRADGRIYNYGGGLGGSSLSTITNVLSMAAGRYQGLAVKRDGKVVDLAQTWPAVTNLSGIIGVASTYSGPEFAVRSDGSVAWGGSIVNAATNVPYGLAGVRVLDAGYSHCLALLSDHDFPPVFLHNALNTSNFVVSSKGSPQWFGQTNISHDGTNAAQSAAIGNNTASSMRMWIAGPVQVKFWWKVSSATNHGVLSFSAGGNVLTNISGEVDWQQCTVGVPPGNQILQWNYAKDGAAAAGQDAAWVDQLQIIPIPPSILTQPQPASQDIVGGTNVVVAFTVTAYGTPPMNYLWEKDGITVASGSNTNFTMANVSRTNSGTYSVFVFSPYGNAASSNAVLNVRVPQLLGAPNFQPDGSMLLSSTDADGGQLTSADLAHFQVQVSTNLVDWTTLSNALVLTNGAIQLQDADAANASMRYYRIVENW